MLPSTYQTALHDFNSHAHVERDVASKYILLPSDISTHTLTWSVTHLDRKSHTELKISTHTLTWSVTYPLGAKLTDSEISTHTLTWSVTPLTIMW